MKKQRKNASLSKTNVLISQFNLKSTQLQREEKHKKLTSTFSHFKQHLLKQQFKNKQRNQLSREKRPIIQQLKFIVNNKQDDFKALCSMSKRSNSKGKIEEDPKRKLEKLNNQIFEQFYEEINLDREKRKSNAYMWDMMAKKHYKRKTSQNLVQEQIQKTALLKFKDAISKQNEEHQNNVGEKNAQALYMLLKTGRSRHNRNRFESNEHAIQGKYKRIPTEPVQKKQLNQRIETKAAVQKQNQGVKTENFRPSSAKRLSAQLNDKVPTIKQKQQVKVSDQKMVEKKNLQIASKRQIPTKKEIKAESKTEIKAESTKVNKEQKKVNPPDSQVEQKVKSRQNFSEKISESFSNDQSTPQVEQKQQKKPQKEYLVEKSEKNLSPQITRQETKEEKEENNITQKIKALQNILKNESQHKKKELIKFESDVQVKKQDKRIQRQLFTDIPSGTTVELAEKKKVQQKPKIVQNNKPNQQKISLKQYNIQTILTTKYMQAQKTNNNPSKPATLAPPPKLTSNLLPNQNKQTKARPNYQSQDVDQNEIQQVQWNGKPKVQAKPIKQQPVVQSKKDVKTNDVKKVAQIAQKPQAKPKVQQNVAHQHQFQKESEQNTIDQAIDQLIFYTQRMQDIGQYRVNSKDLYNDKSIDKELVKAYKICSYYMAHQFLYLTQILLELLESQNISRDYYTVSNDELVQLQKAGHLDEEIENLRRNVDESKKLLRKCYEQCKPFLQKSEQLLSLQGHTNYYKRCCSLLIKEFKKMLELLNSKPDSAMIQKRCCYLIEMFCVLKMFNSQHLKDYEEVEEIEDLKAHINNYKHFLIGT